MNFIDAFKNFFGAERKSNDFISLGIYTPQIYTPEFIGLTTNRKKITQTWEAYRAHELVFACINKIADVMNDAQIIVEKKNAKGEWQKVEGHLMAALFRKPNPFEIGADFRRLMVQSEQSIGIFYGEIIRSGAGIPVEIYPLNPNRIIPWLTNDRTAIDYYQYQPATGVGIPRRILPTDMLIRRRVDLINRFYGFAPLQVALKTVNSDVGLTDYVDAFFESDGTPSGILKILNASISDTKREELQAKWRQKYSRGGSNQKGIAVLDKDAEFQRIGANLNELAADSLSDRFETRVCAPFGVPPLLVGALVGLKHVTARATATAALQDFWANKVSPELAVLREWLTWFLLPEFENIDLIKAEKVRVSFDISQAAFLQEDINNIHDRARKNYAVGGWTLNEFREATGKPPRPDGDVLKVANTQQPNSQLNQNTDPSNPPAKSQKKEPELLSNEKDSEIIPESTEKKTKKSVEFDGLTLAREPRGVELVINLKSLVNDFQSEKEKAINILLKFRKELIDEAADELDKLSPETAYQLTLSPNSKTRKNVEKVLQSAYKRGRQQITEELNAQKQAKNLKLIETKDDNNPDNPDISEITDITISKIINEIQSRAVNWYVSLKTLGSYTLDLLKEKLSGESTKFVEQQAGNSVNASIRAGRADEIETAKDEWQYLEYSAILDVNTCPPCEDADGQTATDIADLPDAPNPDCEGGPNCRCFIVAVAD